MFICYQTQWGGGAFVHGEHDQSALRRGLEKGGRIRHAQVSNMIFLIILNKY